MALDIPSVLEAMERCGGSFVRALAAAYRAADPLNQERLRAAFPDYWTKYAEIARLIGQLDEQLRRDNLSHERPMSS
jgi:hypothetical protein